MSIASKLSQLVDTINEEEGSAGAAAPMGGGSAPASSSGGTGTVSDLGQPPIYGFPNKRRKIKKKVPKIKVTEALDDFDDSQIKTEDDEMEDAEEIVDSSREEESEDIIDDLSTQSGSPEESDNYSEEEIENAEQVLDDTDDSSPVEPEDNEKEVKSERPKVPISRVLAHKVFKPVKNTHSKEQLTLRNLAQSSTINQDNPMSLSNRLNVTSESFWSGLMENAREREEEDGKEEIVIGEITRQDDRYVFAARISIGQGHRDFIFEGNYEQLEALLTILEAKLEDAPGKADRIMDMVNQRVDPVRVYVKLDSLMTDGVQYAKQILAK